MSRRGWSWLGRLACYRGHRWSGLSRRAVDNVDVQREHRTPHVRIPFSPVAKPSPNSVRPAPVIYIATIIYIEMVYLVKTVFISQKRSTSAQAIIAHQVHTLPRVHDQRSGRGCAKLVLLIFGPCSVAQLRLETTSWERICNKSEHGLYQA
jgi:hypothetical protein